MKKIILAIIVLVMAPITVLAQPENDDFNNATVIDRLPFEDTINTIHATTASDDPETSCAYLGNMNSVWYSFTASRDTRIAVNTAGSDYDTILSVWSGTQGALTEISCVVNFGSNQPMLVDVLAGQKIFFMVGSFDSEGGGNLTFSASAAPPFPKTVDISIAQEKEASAEFMNIDGCIRKDVSLFAGVGRETDPGFIMDFSPKPEPFVGVIYAVNDICNAQLLRSGFGITNVNFQMDQGLNAAHVSTAIPATDDQNGTTITIYVNMDWIGIGNNTELSVNDHTTTPDFTINLDAMGKFRDAIATGTVSDGIDNFTPSESVSAGFGIVKIGSITIQH